MRLVSGASAAVERPNHPALEVGSLFVSLDRRREQRQRLDGISLSVAAGGTVGLVGESGSGKSLTSRAALGLFPLKSTRSGSVKVDGVEVLGAPAGVIADIRRHRAAMVFQDPRASINPVRKLGDFITESSRVAGAKASESESRAVRLLDEVGIREPEQAMQRYPQEFSGGMLQRVMIAAALMCAPKLLLADEATTALDVTTQAEVVSLLKRMQRLHGTGTLLVTHNLELAASSCDRVYVMYAGRVVESATSDALFDDPQHPYTRGLLASSPSVRGPRVPIHPIPGRPVALADAGEGCAFRDRCPKAGQACHQAVPPLAPSGRTVAACFFPGEVAAS